MEIFAPYLLGCVIGIGVAVFFDEFINFEKYSKNRITYATIFILFLVVTAMALYDSIQSEQKEQRIRSIHCIEGFEYVQRDKDRFDPLWEIIDGEAMPKLCE